MRKFSRSIQRRRAALFPDSAGLVSAEAADARRAEVYQSPEYLLSQVQEKAQRIAQQRAALDDELKTLEHAKSSISAQIRLPAAQCVD